MKATDVEPTRLDAAHCGKTFLDDVPEKFRVGVVSFASTRAAVGVAPTEDRELVVTALDTGARRGHRHRRRGGSVTSCR